jgi:patatin-like phospholipase/acyl hydrolase
MTELFDLIAGTDTGAIIAGSLAVKSEINNNLVENSMKFF